MAKGRLVHVGQLLPKALEGLAQRAGGEGAIGPAWAQAAGVPINKVSRAVALRAGTLEIEVDGEPWAKELLAQQGPLLERLRATLGGQVKKLAFRVSKRPAGAR